MIAPPPFHSGYHLQRLAGLDLAGELLHQLAPIGADPAPVAHLHYGAESLAAFTSETGETLVSPRNGASITRIKATTNPIAPT